MLLVDHFVVSDESNCIPSILGKTATVRSVITELQEQQSSGEVPEFQYFEINGSKFIFVLTFLSQ